jgi:hypothetical protein
MPSPAYWCLHCKRPKAFFDRDWRIQDEGLMCQVCYLLLHYIVDDKDVVPKQKVLPEKEE